MNIVYIVLPVFNGEDYILEQLMSIYNQTYRNWELIIINDFSSDNTVDIIKTFISNYKLQSKVFFYENEKNLGVNYTIERGLKIIKERGENGDFVAYCDADDIWTRNKLETQVKSMKVDDYNVSYHDLALIDTHNEIISPSFQYKLITPFSNPSNNSINKFCLAQHVSSTTMMFKHELITKLLPFSNATFQDHRTILILSILDAKKIFFINRKLGFYRRHKGTLSIKKATVEQRSNKILKLVENAYAITKSKSLLKHIDILEDKIKYCNTPFYRGKVLFYTLIKHPDIFLYIIRNLITFPIRKIYGYFLYEF